MQLTWFETFKEEDCSSKSQIYLSQQVGYITDGAQIRPRDLTTKMTTTMITEWLKDAVSWWRDYDDRDDVLFGLSKP